VADPDVTLAEVIADLRELDGDSSGAWVTMVADAAAVRLESQAASIAELTERCAKLELDAARYRHMREIGAGLECVGDDGVEFDGFFGNASLDKFIDESIARRALASAEQRG